MRTNEFHGHLFGPVPSRRLGRSLGIDLVPHKVCTLDCIYCECGKTTLKTLERREWVPTDEVLADLDTWLNGGGVADYITFAGSGEPLLHRDIGRIARWLCTRTAIPLALLTNGNLLADPAVRAELAPLSLVVPSLDAADDATYARINRPHAGLTVADQVEGLIRLREEFAGQIWLEILLVEGVNDSEASLAALGQAAARIRPDQIQVNTAVRPGTERYAQAATEATLARALAHFGPTATAVAGFAPSPVAPVAIDDAALAAAILGIAERRPETVTALAAALRVPQERCERVVHELVAAGRLALAKRDAATFVTLAP